MLVEGMMGGRGKLIYEQPGRKLHLQHSTASLEEE